MIYVVLNFTIALLMTWLVIYVDRKDESEHGSMLKEILVCLIFYALGIGLSTYNAINNNSNLTVFFGKIAYSFFGFYSVSTCFYIIQFPFIFKNKSAGVAIKYILYAAAVYLVFNHITTIDVTDFLGYKIRSDAFFTGRISFYLSYTWHDVYIFTAMFLLPVLSLIIMLLRNENSNSKLNLQKAVINIISYALGIAFYFLMKKALKRSPLFSTLYVFPLCLIQICFIRVHLLKTVYDWRGALGSSLGMFLKMILPSMMVGFVFTIFWNLRSSIPWLFVVLNLVVIFAAITLSYQLTKVFAKLKFFARTQYEAELEVDLPTLNFDFEPDEVMEQMRNICMTDVGMSSFRILIDNGVDAWESSFDSEGFEKVKIDHHNRALDALMNTNTTILFKDNFLHSNSYKVDREELLDVFEKTGSDAIIILNEGRHILGMLAFGPKVSGNIYSDYDFNVFTKLYSYFFVFGYYMKNIANQSIVGTVNREIKMSAQLITSIQENVDRIKNPKYETGYLMVPSHNIGGEFVDLIRLSEDKHIFVLGDLSGKGISASMSMVITKSIIRGFLTETKDFKLLVQKVNSFIRYNLPKGTFFEGIFGLIDFKDNTIYYVNCGIPTLLLYNRSFNTAIEIQGEGKVLGFAKDISSLIKVKKINLNAGDFIFACTDGLLDATNLRGEKFGKDRIQKSIVSNAALPADNLSRAVFNSLKDFRSKELEDDVSILIIRAKK